MMMKKKFKMGMQLIMILKNLMNRELNFKKRIEKSKLNV